MHTCTCGGQRTTSAAIPHKFLPFFLNTGPLTKVSKVSKARLAGQGTIHLPSLPQVGF